MYDKQYMILNSTSSDNIPKRLPNKIVLGGSSESYLFNNKHDLEKFILSDFDKNKIYIGDAEIKRGFSIFECLIENEINCIDYKPNDLTMEAADLTLLNYFSKNVSQKNMAVYGTGNLAFKLALRLAERNVNVHIYGRDKQKVKLCIEALKQICFDDALVNEGNYTKNIDGLVSFVTAEEIIDEKFIDILNDSAICLDGGIGNFSKEFIKSAIEKGHEVRRLDVRQSQEIMDGYIKSRINSEFDKIIGRDEIENQTVVAGGIMGRDGEIIVDNITTPSKVIGIANGIGGVKNQSELSDEERKKIEKIQSYIEQNL